VDNQTQYRNVNNWIFQESKKLDIRDLGLRTIIRGLENNRNLYEFMSRGTSKKEAFLLRRENYAKLANYSCEFLEIIPKISTAITSAFWFRRGSRDLYSNFTER